MPSAQLRPDYLAGTARVIGGAGTFQWHNGLLTAIERRSTGVYVISIENADSLENTVVITPTMREPGLYSYGFEFDSDTDIVVRTTINGEPADFDFNIELHRVRPSDPSEELATPTAAPLPAPLASQAALLSLEYMVLMMRAAMSGFMEQVLNPDEPDTLSAAALNAAAAGTYQVTFTVTLSVPLNGNEHVWCQLVPVLTPAENCTDAQIAAPTVIGDPAYSSGVLSVTMTLDTDAGATKVYQAGDEVSCEVQVSAADTLLGFDVASVTKTYEVV